MPDPNTPGRKLTIVDDESEGSRAAGSGAEPGAQDEQDEQGAAPTSSSRAWIAWLLLAAAAVFAWQWLTQLERVESLEAEVAALEGRLGDAESEIAAWARHSDAVRDAVEQAAAGISVELEALEAAVAGAPGETGPGAPATGGAAAAGAGRAQEPSSGASSPPAEQVPPADGHSPRPSPPTG